MKALAIILALSTPSLPDVAEGCKPLIVPTLLYGTTVWEIEFLCCAERGRVLCKNVPTEIPKGPLPPIDRKKQ